jgi:hypothetical protein
MSRVRLLITVVISTAITVAAFAAPVSAASAKLAIVNGIPGRTVDVCIGTNEVRSNLRYGRWTERSVTEGTRVIRFRAAAPGTCSGAILAQKSVTIGAGADLTIAGTAKAPKVVVFDNAFVETKGASDFFGAVYWIRHAADVGDVVFYGADLREFGGSSPEGSPAAGLVTSWSKGQQVVGEAAGPRMVAVAAAFPGSVAPLASTVTEFGASGDLERIEWILVGSKPSHARFVTIKRTLPAPLP